ncbi:leucine-rich repeat domain-containing protein [Aspergillus saccharolyticus JOP 1030-1]|uniref:Leucine rich repeat domain protein n=1 Tax=Aspergillus saccharolyticus JOP 1030-1 TaxID=1450539 RepID=A0A318ZR43_9EURO|nr:leucine rich repeat domain protein [Aspergillus saccharolyticus JOP 1030-1]PYH50089.1 leucine rich repeat domain protein [Aspergillus saccharolyticus JOP 1030-1]
MEKLNSEDGQLFIKNLASFVRTHEKALANALQLKRQPPKNAQNTHTQSGSSASSASSTLAAALSFGPLRFASQSVKPAKLTLTPHHLFYLLSCFEELSIAVGPLNVRLENIHADISQSYVSFLNKPQRSRGDRDSIHSVSSVRSVMSGMSSLWSSFGLVSKDSVSKSEKAKAALEADTKYLYSAFTKIPCLRLAPDRRARLIRGYEEFPFDTAVPLHSFKNLSALEIIDIDFRSFFGWDRLSEQLRTLTIKRANIDDPAELLTGIVLDDIDKRRRRSTRHHNNGPMMSWSQPVHPRPVNNKSQTPGSLSAPGSPVTDTAFGTSSSPQAASMVRMASEGSKSRHRTGSISPSRPTSSKHSSYRHSRGNVSRIRRTGSGSSNSSDTSGHRNGSSSNLLTGVLPASKWRFLRHLGLPDNSLTSISAAGLAPVANTLHSLDISANLFTEVPDSLSTLVALRALNLSQCMIESLHSLSRNPLPAITALNLRGNRLRSLAGIERLLSLERLDLRDNDLSDPTEIARLTNLPEIREIWVSGNSFVKTHPNYRVTIFNLFRRTPGYSEDITIDGSGPGYTERKQLVERAAEPEAAPVVRSAAADHSAVISKPSSNTISQVAPSPHKQERPTGRVFQGEFEVGSTRRKKGARRRIIDRPQETPSTDGNDTPGAVVPSTLSVQHVQPLDDPFISPSTDCQWKSDGGPQARLPSPKSSENVDHEQIHPTAQNAESLTTQPASESLAWSMERDFYRRELEALRQELGNAWLAQLGGQSWKRSSTEVTVPRTGTDFTEATRLPADSLSMVTPPVILSGGHALT